jgi:hypothetical protein
MDRGVIEYTELILSVLTIMFHITNALIPVLLVLMTT